MRKLVALVALLASCEPFEQRNDMQEEDARDAFRHWQDLIIAGKMAESVQMMTWSYKSQWLYDRLTEGDPLALQWRVKLQGNARTDLDLWIPQAATNTSLGRVRTLPPTVQADATLDPLFIRYLEDAALDLRYEFRKVEIVSVSVDRRGVSVQVRNSRGEPEMYAMVIDGGRWKLDHHRINASR